MYFAEECGKTYETNLSKKDGIELLTCSFFRYISDLYNSIFDLIENFIFIYLKLVNQNNHQN